MKGVANFSPAIALWIVTTLAAPAREPRPTPNPAFPRGHVIFQTGFEEPDSPVGWSGHCTLEPGLQSHGAVAVELRAAGHATVTRRFPIEQWRGYTIRGSAMVKAEGVSAKPNSWNGPKFMLSIESPGRKIWPQAQLDTGTYDWRRAVFSVRIPDDAGSATLYLGLEQVTGKAWFDDIVFTVAKPPPGPNPPPVPGPMFKGHDLPRLRGAMVGPHIDKEGLRVLGREWNANLIRWQLIRHGRPGQAVSTEDYDAWLDGELQRLDAALPLCERYGLHVALDLHSPPGGKATVSGYIGSDDRLFTDRSMQDKFVEVWMRLAERYRTAKPIWGYDLANEPVEEWVADDCDDWRGLAERTAKAIRAIDPARAIIVEAPPWGAPDSLAVFTPIPIPNIVYSAHMYVPGAFTHQGVHKPGAQPVDYPGIIAGKMWDKDALKAVLKPIRDFQRNYNTHIYIGEFSAIRWAPSGSASRYLRDVIDIFEECGWDWSYHAFREWNGWSVEHGPDRRDTQPAPEVTDRQRLLRRWFAANKKPTWTHAGDNP